MKNIIHHDQVKLKTKKENCFNIWKSMNIIHLLIESRRNTKIIQIDDFLKPVTKLIAVHDKNSRK